MFFLMHDLFTFTLRNQELPLGVAMNFFNMVGVQIKRLHGCYLDVELLFESFIEQFGREKVIQIIEQSYGKLLWDPEDIEVLRGVVEREK